ncbi:MAG: hypothetical protein ABIG96_02840 [Candidatus Micrarchaeota archaeon]
MNESIKVFIVKCGSCNSKQVWDASMKHKVCGECNTNVVLKTVSTEELKGVKARVGSAQLTFSNYLVYSLGPEDVEEAVAKRKERQLKMKADVEERKKYAQLERIGYFGRKKLLNDGNGKLYKKMSRK